MAEQEATQISLDVGVVCRLPSGCMYSGKGMGRRETCTFLVLRSGCAFTRDGTVRGKRRAREPFRPDTHGNSIWLFHILAPARPRRGYMHQPSLTCLLCKKYRKALSFSLSVLLCSRCSGTQIRIANFSSFYFRTVSNFTSGGPEK